MKKTIYLLLALPLFMASCNNDEVEQGEETIEVCFNTNIPSHIATRTEGSLSVNKVVCAVFEKGIEKTNLRDTIDITNPAEIVYTPRLAKGRTYNVVFWAMMDDNYDVTDLKSINRATDGSVNETDYDAFTATQTIFVQNSETISVALSRPFAQLNLGITTDDWNIVKNSFGQTPCVTTIKYTSKDSFNALTGEANPEITEITRTSNASGTIYDNVHNKEYKLLGMCYVLMAEAAKETIYINYSVTDTQNKMIIANNSIAFVPIQRNYKTNIVGGLLTGTINYQISIENNFLDE